MNTFKQFFKAMLVLCILLIVFVLVFLKVPEASPDNLVKVHGIIEDINTSGGENDIVFKVKGGRTYFINRGLEKGLVMDSLKLYALNHEADLYLVKMRMNLVAPNHIAKVVAGDKILYTHVSGE